MKIGQDILDTQYSSMGNDSLASLERDEVRGGRGEAGVRGRRGPVQLRLALAFIKPMVIILDVRSAHGAHVWTETGNFTCLRHFFTSTAVINRV